jgi:hypothetical protein
MNNEQGTMKTPRKDRGVPPKFGGVFPKAKNGGHHFGCFYCFVHVELSFTGAVVIKELRSNSSNRKNVLEQNHTKGVSPTTVLRKPIRRWAAKQLQSC